jgi:PadR family transcriptional regulator AphA
VTSSTEDLTFTEWAVLGFIAESDTHGFSIAKLFTPDGEAGKVWTVARPLVYRAIDTLITAGYVRNLGSVPGAGGPRRTLIGVTPSGTAALAAWLDTPIEHVRDARSHLLMKLLLIQRRGGSMHAFARRQRATLEGMTEGLERQLAEASGFDITILRWRLSSVQALDRFLDGLSSN